VGTKNPISGLCKPVLRMRPKQNSSNARSVNSLGESIGEIKNSLNIFKTNNSLLFMAL